MSEDARPRRRYDATLRAQRAAQTRARILEAAQRAFLARGYAGATIPSIATEAGVAVETIYRAAPGKAGLLAAVVEAALAGGSENAALAVEARPGIRRVIEEKDPVRKLQLYASTQPGVYGRAGGILRVLDEAAPSTPELADLRDGYAERRLAGMRHLCSQLAERGALRTGLSPERAADILVTVCSRANYDSLVIDRGWTPRAYRDWVADTLVRTLLEP
jgi:AcrR family transcriptional regulator